jgi:hypothetical protein
MNLLVNERVDLVLHGHEHTYQRGKQLAPTPRRARSIAATGYNRAASSTTASTASIPRAPARSM